MSEAAPLFPLPLLLALVVSVLPLPLPLLPLPPLPPLPPLLLPVAEAWDFELEEGMIDWIPLAIVENVLQFDELGCDCAAVGVFSPLEPFV